MPWKIPIFDNEKDSLAKVYIHLLSKEFQVEATIDVEEIIPRTLRIKPDIVLLNSDAPGFNGTEVCAAIKNKMKVPVVLMLNKDSASSIKIDSCSADEIIYKPVDVNMLSETIKRLVTMAG